MTSRETFVVIGAGQAGGRAVEAMRDAGFDILNDVVLNQVLVSFGDADEVS